MSLAKHEAEMAHDASHLEKAPSDNSVDKGPGNVVDQGENKV